MTSDKVGLTIEEIMFCHQGDQMIWE